MQFSIFFSINFPTRNLSVSKRIQEFPMLDMISSVLKELNTLLLYPRNRQGCVQMRTFEPNNESADCWSAAQSYNFIIRVK